MSTTAQTIITASYQLLGATGQGETPAPEQLTAGLNALNLLTDSLSTQKAFISAIQSTIVTLVTTTQSYTIGTGGVFNVTRPIKIEEAKLVLVDPGATATGKLRLPLDLITYEEFSALQPRNLASTTPTKLYNDHAFPLSTLYFWPIPTFAVNTPTVELFYWVPVPSFSTLSATVNLAPGYERALKFQLAIDLAPEVGTPAQANLPAILQVATQAMAAITTLNQQIEHPDYDTAQQAPTPPTP